MIKNIFLTGKIQIGKSTVIEKIISDSFFCDIRIKGFRTKPVIKNGLVIGHSLASIGGDGKQFVHWNPHDPAQKNIDLSVFEKSGVASLVDAIEKADVILMDEVGIMEEKAAQFKNMIIRCLNSQMIVLGVFQERAQWFFNIIKNRHDTHVFRISKNNREMIHEDILKLINISKKNLTNYN